MDCILNHCHALMANDILVVGFYGTAVLTMIACAFLSKSNTIRKCALLIGGSWLITIFGYFYLDRPAAFIAATLFVDSFLAWRFWRMAQRDVFPAGLCLILTGEIAFVLAAKAVALDAYWTAFWLNRIFEITLLYIIGGSLLRLRLLRAGVRAPEHSHGRRKHYFGDYILD
ncbi:MAG: hypothetical protein ABL957_15900 [Parvularculaceae bacterium]